MNVVIFVGPTLPVDQARAILDATYLPPAAQGDVYRAALERPTVIGIVDGVFERTPSVWHKEILWALSQGIHVFGASSMGALRAAELCAFGMQGVGEIFDAFRTGELEDDDEVTVAHADAAGGHRPTSEAMVNIRATLRAAEAKGVIDADSRALLERMAKGLFYPERSYPAVLALGRERGLGGALIDALAAFVKSNRINLKADDARTMLRQIASDSQRLARPVKVDFVFENTDSWNQVVTGVDRRSSSAAGAADDDRGPSRTALAEELRLRGHAYPLARRGAMLRALAADQSRREGMTLTTALMRGTQEEFRRARQLVRDDAIWKWIADNDLDEPGFGRLLEGEARLKWMEALYQGEALRHLRSEIMALGLYPEVRARAAHKQEVLAARGLDHPGPSDVDLSDSELLRWYFEDRLGRPIPADRADYMKSHDLAGEEELRQEALREYLYLKLTG